MRRLTPRTRAPCRRTRHANADSSRSRAKRSRSCRSLHSSLAGADSIRLKCVLPRAFATYYRQRVRKAASFSGGGGSAGLLVGPFRLASTGSLVTTRLSDNRQTTCALRSDTPTRASDEAMRRIVESQLVSLGFI